MQGSVHSISKTVVCMFSRVLCQISAYEVSLNSTKGSDSIAQIASGLSCPGLLNFKTFDCVQSRLVQVPHERVDMEGRCRFTLKIFNELPVSDCNLHAGRSVLTTFIALSIALSKGLSAVGIRDHPLEVCNS